MMGEVRQVCCVGRWWSHSKNQTQAFPL